MFFPLFCSWEFHCLSNDGEKMPCVDEILGALCNLALSLFIKLDLDVAGSEA